MSKPKQRKNSEDLETKNKKNGMNRKTNRIPDNSSLNFHGNDKQSEDKTEEIKREKKDNWDIIEVLTNSDIVDNTNETRVKNSYPKKPLDLIEEYRTTIVERYTQRVLDGTTPDLNYSPALYNCNNYMASKRPVMYEDNNIQTSSLPQSIASSKRTSPERNYKQIEKSPKTRKRPKSWKKIAQRKMLAQDSSMRDNSSRSRQKGKFDGSMTINPNNRSYSKGMTKRKVNVRKQIEHAAAWITVGELIKFYKTRRPTKEDLNIIQVCMALIHSHMRSHLFKIGIEYPDDIKKVTWKTARSFFETHVKSIVPILKGISQRFYTDEKHEVLRGLIILYHHKVTYTDNSSLVLSEFINACNSFYK